MLKCPHKLSGFKVFCLRCSELHFCLAYIHLFSLARWSVLSFLDNRGMSVVTIDEVDDTGCHPSPSWLYTKNATLHIFRQRQHSIRQVI